MIKIIVMLLISSNVFSQPVVSEKDVIDSAYKHFPQILQSLVDIEIAQAKVKESKGNFDSVLNLETDQRASGYYDGKYLKLKVSKPLQMLNSKFYTGVRRSDGEFPIYEGKNNTLNQGETFLGVSFSLLRNRSIDSKRLKLFNNKLNLSIKESKALGVALKIKKVAKEAYWDWIEQLKSYRVFLEIYELAIKRQSGIKTRIQKGDLAKIYQSENEQYILKRKNKLLESKQKLMNASLMLSLFYRDEKGKPQNIGLTDGDYTFAKVFSLDDSLVEKDLASAIGKRADLKILDFERKQFLNEIQNAQNDLTPKLDMKFEVSKDNGDGPKNLQQQELRAMVNFELPIERNLGAGKVAKVKAKVKRLDFEKRYVTEQLRVKAYSLKNKINALNEIITNAKKEVELASLLQKAEIQKFDKGASDFFVINIREQNLADAKIRLISANAQFKKIYAEYEELMFYPY